MGRDLRLRSCWLTVRLWLAADDSRCLVHIRYTRTEQSVHRTGTKRTLQIDTVLNKAIDPVYLAKLILEPVRLACPYESTNLRAAVRGTHEFFGRRFFQWEAGSSPRGVREREFRVKSGIPVQYSSVSMPAPKLHRF